MQWLVIMTYNRIKVTMVERGDTADIAIDRAIKNVQQTHNLSLQKVALGDWTIKCVHLNVETLTEYAMAGHN